MVTKIKSSKASGLAAVQPQAPVPFNPVPGAEWLQAWVDAISRIAVELSNRAPNDTIATLGNLSHDAVGGGFVGPDGQTVVSRDASFIHIRDLILPSNNESAIAALIDRLEKDAPAAVFSCRQARAMNGNRPVAVPPQWSALIGEFSSVSGENSPVGREFKASFAVGQ